MAKVKIDKGDYRRFAKAAAAAGTPVEVWLTEAARTRAARDEDAALSQVWQATLQDLDTAVMSPQLRSFLHLADLRTIVEDTALLAVPDAFTRDVIESRLRPAVTEALNRRLSRPVHVAVTLAPAVL